MRKPVRRRDGQDGLTIIELMIAMAILGMGMVAAVSLHLGTARNNTNGNIFTQANMLAQAQLETLKNQDITALVAGGPFPNANLSLIPLINPDGQNGGIFRRYWTIQNIGTDARRITVTVEWNRLGRQRQVVIASNTKGNGV
ncbi:MAG: prepilin-type N-terminal cleavage/methylation domain-containing protein [Deltaproteobacteria bacterium]|nr:prepilin-type N-terminal cleavage/methylation domain-containing protein [Deltaproteobacteria bacterium]